MQCMNSLADRVHKQEETRSAMYHNMATLFNNHPYISSSKFSASWHATATYVGMLLNAVAMLWSAYHCVHDNSCLCTLSASAFMH